jgi:hypothetical protein
MEEHSPRPFQGTPLAIIANQAKEVKELGLPGFNGVCFAELERIVSSFPPMSFEQGATTRVLRLLVTLYNCILCPPAGV